MADIRLNTRLVTSLGDVLFMSAADMISATGIANSTWYNMMQKPEGITVQQLLAIANGLHVPARRLFSSGKASVIGRREDYVVEPYQECRYDDDALRAFVSSRQSATWKKAAEAAGMSYQRLKDSLTAVTRTPVVRFLTVCDVFGVDPFTILVDPNPACSGRRQKSMRKSDAESFSSAISAMRNRIDELSKTVQDLTAKYEALLKDHEQLARRVQVNIGTINGSNISTIGIAADPLTSPDTDADK